MKTLLNMPAADILPFLGKLREQDINPRYPFTVVLSGDLTSHRLLVVEQMPRPVDDGAEASR